MSGMSVGLATNSFMKPPLVPGWGGWGGRGGWGLGVAVVEDGGA